MTQKSSTRMRLPKLPLNRTWTDWARAASNASLSSSSGMKSCKRMPCMLPPRSVTHAKKREALCAILRSSPNGTTTSQISSNRFRSPELSLSNADAPTSLRTSASAARAAEWLNKRTTVVWQICVTKM